VLEHQEVCNEGDAVKTVGIWGPASCHRHRQLLKGWTQDNGGSQKKLAAIHGWLLCCEISATHKGHGYQGPGRADVARGTPNRQMLGKRYHRGARQQLCLRKERPSSRIFRKTAKLEIRKQMSGLQLGHEE
jgi:hypothetical protein